ncbi:oxidoreductase [Streptomyces sp. NBC_01352]|uniref:oxidoreductase n=1 Tax=unclassified Streptomyces TaxID=2593676 RepID=UPI002256BFB9|nr:MULTISPECIES: oxidoreductase [unclassified Streptomyces]MCX4706880.1 oxidoreductase [Streptomyces sp. NBC_01373]
MTTTRPVALVTGATSGIGKEAARAFAAAGYEVIGTGRKTSGLGPPAGVTYLDLDVGSDDSATAAVAEVIDRFGRIDVLVNNAGIGAAGAVEENSVAQAQAIFNINVFGVMRMTKAVLPHMRAQGGGRVINISSVLGVAPQPFMALYVAAKHAIEGYSESLDHEVREHGVRVLIVQPAYTKTPFETNAAQPDTPLPLYAEGRRNFDEMVAEAMEKGDEPAVVAKAIVTAATDKKPKLRYTAGPLASRVTKARRLVPAGTFDKQIRKINRLPG